MPAFALLFAFGITISFPPTPLPKALELLSKPAGLTLKCSAGLKDEVVIAHLKDAPRETALKYLAESLNARWDKKSDTEMLLIPDPLAKQKREQEIAKADEKVLENSLAYLRDRLAKQPEEADVRFVREYQRKFEMEEANRKAAREAKDYARMLVASTAVEESPGWRANARIVLAIGSKTLLKMRNDERLVWAEHPTPMQRTLPREAANILVYYRRELALLKPEAQVARIKFYAQRWETGGSYNTALIAFDAAGNELDHAYVRLNDDANLLKKPYNERNTIAPVQNETPIDVSAEAAEAREALSNESEVLCRQALLQKWLPKMLDPVQYEPTQWHTGADLWEAAKGLRRNMIGTVTDLTGSRYWTPKVALTPSQVFAKNKAEMKEMPDGWIVLRPSGLMDRAPRMEAKALLQASYKAGGVSLDAAAAWTARMEYRWPMISWVGDYLSAMLTGYGPYSGMATLLDDEALRLWDSLGPALRERLKRGDPAKIATLSTKTKALLFQRAFWHKNVAGVSDPTDELPNGIEDGEISIKMSETPVIIAWHSAVGKPASPMPVDPETLGRFLAKGDPYREVSSEEYRVNDRFLLGFHRSYTLDVLLMPGSLRMQIGYGETFFKPDQEPVERLPREIAERVEKARQQALAQPPPKVPPPAR